MEHNTLIAGAYIVLDERYSNGVVGQRQFEVRPVWAVLMHSTEVVTLHRYLPVLDHIGRR